MKETIAHFLVPIAAIFLIGMAMMAMKKSHEHDEWRDRCHQRGGEVYELHRQAVCGKFTPV